MTGISRVVLAWYSANAGIFAACWSKRRVRSSPSGMMAFVVNVSSGSSMVTSGFARML